MISNDPLLRFQLSSLVGLIALAVAKGAAEATATATTFVPCCFADGLMLVNTRTGGRRHHGRENEKSSLMVPTTSFVSYANSPRRRRRRKIQGPLGTTFRQPSTTTTTTRRYQSMTERDGISSSVTYADGQQQKDDQQEELEHPSSLVSLEELTEYASQEGIDLTFNLLGPGYRSVARFDPPKIASDDSTSSKNKQEYINGNKEEDSRLVLGYVEGFVRPSGNILHLDKMEAFQPILNRAKRQYQRQYELAEGNDGGDDDQVTGETASATVPSPPPILYLGGISFGVGLLMGYQCLLHGKSKGCTRAEFLAIDDAPKQHRRLVKYYKRVGFQVVKYVGDDWKDVPDRLVWGGCGTLMTEDIDVLLTKWSKLIRLMKERSNEKKR